MSRLVLARVRWFGENAKRTASNAAERALYRASHHLLEEANRTIPFREGILMGSGYADNDDHRATVSYDTPYAKRQHEELTYRHPGGRRAKWLEQALNEQRGALFLILAREMRSRMRR